MSTRFRLGPTTFLTTIALWERIIRGGGPVDPSPTNTVQPFITGDLFVGETLTCYPGVWYGAPYPTFTYQWQVWNGTAFEDLVGETNQTYVAAADTDYRCLVTGTNLHGSLTVESDTVDIEPALQAPAFSVLPSISGNTTTGSTLTLDPGVHTGNPAPSSVYQWQFFDTGTSTWGDLVGETGLTVVASVDGEYRAQVTLTNSQGTAVEVTASIVVGTVVAPSNLQNPQISGNAYVGSTLYAIPGTWSDADSFGYQWQTQDTSTLVWSDIVGATSDEYVSASAVPHRCVISGINTASTVTANSNTLTVSEVPTGTTTVTHYSSTFDANDVSDPWLIPSGCSISGGAFNFKNTSSNVTAEKILALPAGTYEVEYDILTGDTGLKGNVTIWFNSAADTTDEITRTDVTGTFIHPLTSTAAISSLEIRVTRQDSTMDIKVGRLIVRGTGTGEVNQAPSLDYAPQIRGVLETGETLYATHGVWFANPESSYTIQWYKQNASTSAWEAVSGATSFTFVPSEAGTYRVTVSVSNSEGSSSSNSTSVVVTGESSGGGETPPPVGTYSELRLRIPQTWGAPSVSLAEVKFRATAGGADLTFSSTYASTEANPASNAFDGSTSTWWSSMVGDESRYIGGVLSTPSGFAQLVMTFPNIEPDYYEEAPQRFIVEGWNGTAWVTLMEDESEPVWSPGETRTYTV